MNLSTYLYALVALVYIGLLFLVAIYGERKNLPRSWQPWIYSLSLTIVCSTWAIYGNTLDYFEQGWFISPIFVGNILILLLGFSLLQKVIQVTRREGINSIADLTSSRFGHSRAVAVTMTLLAIVGLVPYMALQLKAITVSFSIVSATEPVTRHWYSDLAFYCALLMALFGMLFGTRKVGVNDRHPGVMLALSFEAVIKLITFLLVSGWILFDLGDGISGVINTATNDALIRATLTDFSTPYTYLVMLIVGFISFLTLPHHFHVLAVENHSHQELKQARWLLPVYIILINLLVLPIAIVGYQYFQGDVTQLEYLTLHLPMQEGQSGLTLLAYVGGLSAATSIVIIASISLSTMLSNEILVPLLIRTRLWAVEANNSDRVVLMLRRGSHLLVLLLAYFYLRTVTKYSSLAEIGNISLIAALQFGPALVLGLYWSRLNRRGVMLGLIGGFGMWFYTLILPLLAEVGVVPRHWLEFEGMLVFLDPHAFMGVHLDPVAHGVLWSLCTNLLGLWIGSAYFTGTFKDRLQAASFVHSIPAKHGLVTHTSFQASIGDLHVLMGRFIDAEKMQELFAPYTNPVNGRLIGDRQADREFIFQSERLLASMLGAPAVRLLFEHFVEPGGDDWRDLSTMVDEASQVFKFNREILHSALQSISQGICIYDRDRNLVAWNQQFRYLFDYPEELLIVGQSYKTIQRHNHEHGDLVHYASDRVELHLEKLSRGQPDRYECERPNGQFIEAQGSPMPGGGYIIVYTDVTEQRNIENRLRRINEELEEKVGARTQELQESNAKLEKANVNKTRFLAAAGHDLVQPLNAAALFAASLHAKLIRQPQEGNHDKLAELSSQIERSLVSADNLLSELLEISKLDSDVVKPNVDAVSLNDVLASIETEQSALAAERGIRLRVVRSSLWITTDPRLIKRMIQNILANAVRYSLRNRISVGVRRHGEYCTIEIWDTGPGLSKQEQDVIFDEFHRLPHVSYEEKGLGLGLAIVKRLSNLLQHPISIKSEIGRGSGFMIRVPVTQARVTDKVNIETSYRGGRSAHILCLDNEVQVVEGMRSLLSEWGHEVMGISDSSEVTDLVRQQLPDLIIIDYHLDNDEIGLDLLTEWKKSWLKNIPVIVITADYTDAVQKEIQSRNYYLLKKPVKPLQLRSLVDRVLN
ncbi:hybrid sensor histidine kinase/response regulator [Gynuella sp.]|uniref:hybrid sensor histidine kinase/response regulator n=1 Tax=Gynuella sp. TaxID=2969146 RepID=UPI003D0CC562